MFARPAFRPLAHLDDRLPSTRGPLPLPTGPRPLEPGPAPVDVGTWRMVAPGLAVKRLLDLIVPKAPAQLFGSHETGRCVASDATLLPENGSRALGCAVATPSLIFRWALCGSAYMAAVHAAKAASPEVAPAQAPPVPEFYNLYGQSASQSEASDLSWDLVSVSDLISDDDLDSRTTTSIMLSGSTNSD